MDTVPHQVPTLCKDHRSKGLPISVATIEKKLFPLGLDIFPHFTLNFPTGPIKNTQEIPIGTIAAEQRQGLNNLIRMLKTVEDTDKRLLL